MKRVHLIAPLLLSCLVVLGCKSSKSGLTGGGGSGSSPDVTGSFTETYVGQTGTVKVPVDITGYVVDALVPKAGGGFDTIAGTVDGANGTFVIPDVPDAPFHLRVTPPDDGPTFYVDSARTVVFDTRYVGRNDVAPVTSATPLVLNVTGMSPWQDNDDLELFSAGSATYGLLDAETPPAAGDQSLSGLSADCAQLFAPYLVDGSKGDLASVTHLVWRPFGAQEYEAIVDVFEPPSFTQTAGQTTTLNGAFQPVTQQHATVDFRRSQFASLALAANPTATIDYVVFGAAADPTGKLEQSYGYMPTILVNADTETTDVTAPVDYGNPFPASWGIDGSGYAAYTVPLMIPGAAGPVDLKEHIIVFGSLDAMLAGPIAPVVGPPLAVQIGGQPAAPGLTAVGLTPTITWSAGPVGTPDVYIVRVYDVTDPMHHMLAAEFFTSAAEIAVPPGILEAGSPYYLRLESQKGYDPERPASLPVEYASAVTITDVFTP